MLNIEADRCAQIAVFQQCRAHREPFHRKVNTARLYGGQSRMDVASLGLARLKVEVALHNGIQPGVLRRI